LAFHKWHEEDLPSLPREKNIWENWHLQITQTHEHPNNISQNPKAPSKWQPPPQGMIQLNFDRASKGNPGMAGYGGILRDHGGKPLPLFFGSIGWDMNNSVELEGLWQGHCLAQRHGFLPIVIEGDSQILINMANQILQGTYSQSNQQLKISSSFSAHRTIALNQ